MPASKTATGIKTLNNDVARITGASHGLPGQGVFASNQMPTKIPAIITTRKVATKVKKADSNGCFAKNEFILF